MQKDGGFSFKGLLHKDDAKGRRKDVFGIFFHQDPCYHGGPEYGWIFPESTSSAVFYASTDSNVRTITKPETLASRNGDAKGEHFYSWPSGCLPGEGNFPARNEKDEYDFKYGTEPAIGENVSAVQGLLKHPEQIKLWNIVILANGDFKIELQDAASGKTLSCVIPKPPIFPNLHKDHALNNDNLGHVTMSVKKPKIEKDEVALIEKKTLRVTSKTVFHVEKLRIA